MPFNYMKLSARYTLGNLKDMQEYILNLKAGYAEAICDICNFVPVSK